MQLIVLICALATVVVCRSEETYSSRFDNFNAQELVENIRLLKNYAKCFLEEGPCTPEGTEFKKTIPDAVKTKCAKCSAKQKEMIRLVVKALQTKLPDLWQKLVKKEDPKGIYVTDFETFLNISE